MKQTPFQEIRLIPIDGIPLVKPGDDLPGIIIQSANLSKIEWIEGDILVIAQKIISKAEGRLVNLKEINPTKRAVELGTVTQKDPRLVELILQESKKVIRHRKGVLVVQNHPNPRNLIPVGSATKPWTAVAVLQYIENSTISMDTPAYSLLDKVLVPQCGYTTVRVRQCRSVLIIYYVSIVQICVFVVFS